MKYFSGKVDPFEMNSIKTLRVQYFESVHLLLGKGKFQMNFRVKGPKNTVLILAEFKPRRFESKDFS